MESHEIAAADWTFSTDLAGPSTGEPVLLLHGFPETRHMWRHQVAALGAAGYRAVAPDQRGYSRGARPSQVEDYATELLTGDALKLMDALGHEKRSLLGRQGQTAQKYNG